MAKFLKLPLPRVEVYASWNRKLKAYRFYFRKRNRNGKLTEPSQPYKKRRYAAEAARRDVPGVPVVHMYIWTTVKNDPTNANLKRV